MDIAIAILNEDGSPPDVAVLAPWPEGVPFPMEGYGFVFQDERYMVHDTEFNYCTHHDEPTVHITILLGPDEADDDNDSGMDIRLP